MTLGELLEFLHGVDPKVDVYVEGDGYGVGRMELAWARVEHDSDGTGRVVLFL